MTLFLLSPPPPSPLFWFARTYLSFLFLQDKYINREVQTLSLAAHHPNVIDIYGVLSTAGTTFMIMPLVKTDLAKLMQVPFYDACTQTIEKVLRSLLEHPFLLFFFCQSSVVSPRELWIWFCFNE